MTLQRMDHVGVVVDDMEAAKAFFAELGLEPQGGGELDNPSVGRIVGLEGARTEFAMMATPGGDGRIELIKFHAPQAPDGDVQAPSNAPGLRHLCFAVDDVHDVLARLENHGAELVGELENY